MPRPWPREAACGGLRSTFPHRQKRFEHGLDGSVVHEHAVRDAQRPVQRGLERPHDDARIRRRRAGLVRQQRGPVAGGHQALHRVVEVQLDARCRPLASSGEPLDRLFRQPGAAIVRDQRPAARRANASSEHAAAERLDPRVLNGSNRLRLAVYTRAHSGQVLLVAVFDNLGKGAAGAAVQNLELMLGLASRRPEP